MPAHHPALSTRRFYKMYLANLRSRYFAYLRRNREYFLNLYNYLTYNDVD